MTDIYIIIESGYNTSYISSLFIALFYKQSFFDNIINYNSKIKCFDYLQFLIKHNIIDQIRRNYSIETSILNEIRNYCVICGWKKEENITNLFDVADFYKFLVFNFDSETIKFVCLNNMNNNNEISSDCNKYLNLIEIDINTTKINNINLSIDILLDEWVNNNITFNGKFIFKEVPNIISIYIKRNYENKFNNKSIDIMKRIKINGNNNVQQNYITWKIHSLICYSEINPHYYSLILTEKNEWCLFDDTMKSSIVKISNMKNEDFTNKIKTECVMLFYKLD
jgi:hypothetical protein